MAQSMQGADERLTRSGFARKQRKQRQAEEARWARKSGPVRTRFLSATELEQLQRDLYLESIAPGRKR
jgi:hypothetical protein